MNNVLRRPIRLFFIYSLFFVFGVLLYWQILIRFPVRDDLTFLAERAFFEDQLMWLQHILSWSRTRILLPGDFYLFRPLHLGVLGILDVTFQSDLLVRGLSSAAMLAFASSSMFLVLRKISNSTRAWVLSIVFLSFYPGLEMTSWHHISPYLCALGFMNLGVLCLVQLLVSPRPNVVFASVILLTTATLFHETVLLTLSLVALSYSVMLWRQGYPLAESTRTPVMKVLILSIALHLGLNSLDLILHPVPSLLGPADHVRGSLSAKEFVDALFFFPGTAVVAFLAPAFVNLREGYTGVTSWYFDEHSIVYPLLGCFVWIALFGLLKKLLQRRRWKSLSGTNIVALFGTFHLITVLLSVGIGRVLLRGINYLQEASYYYQYTTFDFCLIVGSLLPALPLRTLRLRKIAMSTVAVYLGCTVCLNIYKIKKISFGAHQQRYLNLRQLGSFFSNTPSLCIAGFNPSQAESIFATLDSTFPLILRKNFCRTNDGRSAVYFTTLGNEGIEFGELRRLGVPQRVESGEQLELNANPRFELSDGQYIAREPDGTLEEGKGFLLSTNHLWRAHIRVDVENAFHGGLILNYINPKNFLLFVFSGPTVYGHVMREGVLSKRIMEQSLPHLQSPLRLEIVWQKDDVLLLANHYLLTGIQNVPSQSGRWGLFAQANLHSPMSFKIRSALSGPVSEEIRFENRRHVHFD